MNKIQPIYKLNNGNGAMLCNECRTIISTGPKTKQLYCSKCNPDTVLISESVLIDIAVEQNVLENQFKYKLIRERDQLVNQSKEIKWIEFKKDGRYESAHVDIAVGRSIIMSPFNSFFTWQTTPVVEIVEQREGYIKFKTENSNYELYSL